MDIDADIIQAITRIAELEERTFLRGSALHLSACGGCGGPAFKQPCSLCNFYPMGPDKGHWNPETASKAFFCHAVSASAPDGAGNLATWVLSSMRRSAAYRDNSRFKSDVESAIAEASDWEMPDPAGVYERIAEGGMHYRRAPSGFSRYEFWEAVSALRSPEIEGGFPKDARTAAETAVTRMHDGDIQASCTALRAALRDELQTSRSDRQKLWRAIEALDRMAPEEVPGSPRP